MIRVTSFGAVLLGLRTESLARALPLGVVEGTGAGGIEAGVEVDSRGTEEEGSAEVEFRRTRGRSADGGEERIA